MPRASAIDLIAEDPAIADDDKAAIAAFAASAAAGKSMTMVPQYSQLLEVLGIMNSGVMSKAMSPLEQALAEGPVARRNARWRTTSGVDAQPAPAGSRWGTDRSPAAWRGGPACADHAGAGGALRHHPLSGRLDAVAQPQRARLPRCAARSTCAASTITSASAAPASFARRSRNTLGLTAASFVLEAVHRAGRWRSR